VCASAITLQMELFLLIKCEGGYCWRHKNDEKDVVSWRRRCLDHANKDIDDEKTLSTSC
jgi:hypothetical protein